MGVMSRAAVCAFCADRALVAGLCGPDQGGACGASFLLPNRGGDRRSRQREARRGGYEVERPPDPSGFGSSRSTTQGLAPIEEKQAGRIDGSIMGRASSLRSMPSRRIALSRLAAHSPRPDIS